MMMMITVITTSIVMTSVHSQPFILKTMFVILLWSDLRSNKEALLNRIYLDRKQNKEFINNLVYDLNSIKINKVHHCVILSLPLE